MKLLIFISCMVFSITKSFSYDRVGGYITEITDGDTVKIRVKDEKPGLYRFIAVSAPENKSNTKHRKQAQKCKLSMDKILELGKKSEEFVKDKLSIGYREYIYFGDGYFKRPLIWIDGINDELIKNGHAHVYRGSTPIDKNYKKYLYALEREARVKNIGIWKHIDKPCF